MASHYNVGAKSAIVGPGPVLSIWIAAGRVIFINQRSVLGAVVKSAIWIIALGAGVAVVLAIAYMPTLIMPPKENVPQMQTGGQVKNTLAVGEKGSFRGMVSGGKQPYQFEWTFPDETVVRAMNATHTFDSPGMYEVTVSITDAAGQSDSHSFEIRVTPAQ